MVNCEKCVLFSLEEDCNWKVWINRKNHEHFQTKTQIILKMLNEFSTKLYSNIESFEF